MAITETGWTPWHPLSSSNCKAIRWQQNNKRLRLGQNPLGTTEVVFHQGRTYHYFRVRYRVFTYLRALPRPGKFFYRRWRFGFPYQEIT